ncbi:MAG: M48 family metallopeptidase [Synergistaceae bacterium]|nr:M48 family metallopeptidase [Synergistaceae bacterium]
MMKLTGLLTRLIGTTETALILVLFMLGASEASISRNTVKHAWSNIARAAEISGVSVNFEDDSEPNAWVKFSDETHYSLHVTAGLMRILESESEIAGVLGHEAGHIRLGHYGGMVITDTARILTGTDNESPEGIAEVVGVMEMDLRESSFSREQETEADDYGTKILRDAGYDSRGLYMAMKRIESAGYGSGRNGFNSHPATRERLEHLAEISGAGRNDSRNESRNKSRKTPQNDSPQDIADILMGR